MGAWPVVRGAKAELPLPPWSPRRGRGEAPPAPRPSYDVAPNPMHADVTPIKNRFRRSPRGDECKQTPGDRTEPGAEGRGWQLQDRVQETWLHCLGSVPFALPIPTRDSQLVVSLGDGDPRPHPKCGWNPEAGARGARALGGATSPGRLGGGAEIGN